MSKIKQCFSMMSLLSLFIGVFLIGGPSGLASTNQPPEGAKEFAEQHFHQIVKEIIFSDVPSEWGFKNEMGSITFSELYPIYSLNADFALGQSDNIITDKQLKWVAVIFQDNQPVNAIGTQQTASGNFELAAVGYPPELPRGLLNLKDNEILIHDFPAEEYYVYSKKSNSIMKIEPSKEKYSLSSPQSKEQFQNMLMTRYKNIDEREEDLSGGFSNAPTSHSNVSPPYSFIYPVMIILVLGCAWLYFKRHLIWTKQARQKKEGL